MASITNDRFAGSIADSPAIPLPKLVWQFLTALGSLKIAVAMFAFGTFMLLVGTLAQDEETIVDVKRNYFNSWIAFIDLDVFVPQTVFPHEKPVPYTFAIPGGATIGLVLLVNLFAAKLTRFKMQARGGRFFAGLIVTLLGFLLVGLVVTSAHLGDGLQGEPPFPYDYIWYGSLASLHICTLLSLAWLFVWTPKTKVVFGTSIAIACIFGALSGFMLYTQDTYRIPDPGLRIVWQLTKSLGVGGVLLVGLLLLFGNRGGNVLIHFGVGLLMVGQFIFGDAQTEERVSLAEGQKTSVAIEIDTVELVVIDRSPDDGNRVVAFDNHMIASSLRNEKPLSVEGLPFEIQIDKWMENSDIARRKSPPAVGTIEASMVGNIQEWELVDVPKVGGTSDQTNIASLYYTVTKKEDQSLIGKFAASQYFSDDQVTKQPTYDTIEAASKSYDIGLRFRKNYKDYSITLKDIVLEEYTNSQIPKDYSSYITIKDKDGSILQDGRVWMNSPMRFRGETFYQSNYVSDRNSRYGVEETTLQVVTNAGWLIPYVSCVLVGLGMLVHFGGTFARFSMRYERGVAAPESIVPRSSLSVNAKQIGIAGAVLFLMLAYYYSLTFSKKTDRESIDYQAIGSLPIHFGGRVKPFASAGAEFLEILSNKPYALRVVPSEDKELSASEKEKLKYDPKTKRVPASEWLFAAMMQDDWILSEPLIRIDSTQATADLNLTRVKTNRYSYNDVVDGLRGVGPKLQQIFRDREERKKLSFEDEKLLEVLNKISMIDSLLGAYRPIAPRGLTTGDMSTYQTEMRELEQLVARIRRENNPAILPSIQVPEPVQGQTSPPRNWNTFGVSFFESLPLLLAKEKTPEVEAMAKFMEINVAFREDKKDGAAINKLVEEFRTTATTAFGEDVMRVQKVNAEYRFENMNTFFNAQVFYLIAGLLATLSYAIMPRSLRTVALTICIATLLLHTYAIGARIYISERPPVVSLYSAAVFIGWAMVLFCIVSELLFPIGVPVIVGAVSGYLSLLVAYGLDVGDSMPVLRAVLDTQFWLSTHVISVTLGYSATFFAGIFGIVIVIAHGMSLFENGGSSRKWATLAKESIPVLYRICYGVVCFGLFFSFVGTVLGGLWGDDSWGRFWGWDPKENGALMIVLWNALLLHARWDRLVGSLGFANLAVFGNIVTAWSMFGTNQLGIGLHAYGAFEGDLVRNLVLWVVVQVVFIGAGITIFGLRRTQKIAEEASW